MDKKRVVVAGLLTLIAVSLVATACMPIVGPRVGDLQTETQTVELDNAGQVDVEVEMGVGVLDVSGGASALLEASFAYNVEELKPHVTYAGDRLVVNDEGITAGLTSLFDLDDFRNDWDLKFAEDVPMEMDFQLGAGPANLALGDLNLTSLNVDGGAGRVTIDLTGDWQNDLDATISGGLGPLNLIVPGDVGVRIDVEPGVGGVDASGLTREGNIYTNDLYGQSEVALRVEIEGGAGTIRLDVQ